MLVPRNHLQIVAGVARSIIRCSVHVRIARGIDFFGRWSRCFKIVNPFTDGLGFSWSVFNTNCSAPDSQMWVCSSALVLQSPEIIP